MRPLLGWLAAILLALLAYFACSEEVPSRDDPREVRRETAVEQDEPRSASRFQALGIEALEESPAAAADSRRVVGDASSPDSPTVPVRPALAAADTPATRIELQVVHPTGEPAVGAGVAIRAALDEAASAGDGTPGRDGPIVVPLPPASIVLRSHRELATTDAEGRAVVLVPDALLEELLTITASQGELTAILALRPPQVSRSVVLTLAPLASVEVRVFDAGGLPLARAFVEVRSADSGPSPNPTNARTDELGVATFEGVRPGEYVFRHWDSRTNESHEARAHVRGGERALVVLRLPSDEPRVVASGTVVDERGAPLGGVQVHARLDDGGMRTLTSDARGEFRLTEATGREVEFSIGGMWDDEFEPATLRVSLGTRNAGFRRVRVAALLSVEIVCIDGATGKPLDSGRVRANRYRAGRPDERAEFGLRAGGSGSLIFRDHADWRVELKAHGYHARELALSDALVLTPDRRRLEFRLERAPHHADDPRDR